MQTDYCNGYIEKTREGYEGVLRIDGINLGGIKAGFYSDKKGRAYVWLYRKPILDYDAENHRYIRRTALPFFECYAYKSLERNIAYSGSFFFLHFTYDLVCCWDDFVKDKLNIYIVRSEKQPLINAINKKNNGSTI